MAKLTLSDIGTISSAISVLNANNTAIENAIENTLSRDGTSPNTMNADLDMNSHRVYNLPDAVSETEPVSYRQAVELISEITTAFSTNVFDTKALASLVTMPSSSTWLEIKGYYEPGDGGGAFYTKVDTEPSHTGKLQTADGSWWELSETVIDLRMLGAGVGNSETDTTAFETAFTLLDGEDVGEIKVPPGEVTIKRTINWTLGRFNMSGYGRDVSIIRSAVVGAPTFAVDGSAIRIGISDLTLQGNGLTTSSGNGHGFALWAPAGSSSAIPQLVSMQRVTITDFKYQDTEGPTGDSLGTLAATAIVARNALACEFIDIEIQNCAGALYFAETQNCVLERITASSCTKFGLWDYLNEALSVLGGDIQNCCIDGATFTVPTTMPTANILSYRGSGTLFKGTKTKNAAAGSQIYIQEGRGVRLENIWFQPNMNTDNTHKGVILAQCMSFTVRDCLFDMVVSAFTSKSYVCVEVVNNQNTLPISGVITGNQFNFPGSSQNISRCIYVHGDATSGNRLICALKITNNVFGQRDSISGSCTIDDCIFIEDANLQLCEISGNFGFARTNVTITNGIRFDSVLDGGKNKIGPNEFITSGGTVTNKYNGINESELKFSATLDIGNIADGASETETITATGVVRGDVIVGVAHTSDILGLTYFADITTSDEVKVIYTNNTGGAVNPASGTITIFVKKRQFS